MSNVELENSGRTQFCLGCEQRARRIAELEAALAQQKQMYEQEAKWRKAYQEAKGKMYQAGGDIGQFAIGNMPCNEGELDLWFRKIYVSREAYDSLKAELEAQLKAAMSLLIDWQATANGSTKQRATLAAKVSDWLMKRCADGTWRQLQQDETLDNQTAGETAERGTL